MKFEVFLPLNYVDSVARAMLNMKEKCTFEAAMWALFENGIKRGKIVLKRYGNGIGISFEEKTE